MRYEVLTLADSNKWNQLLCSMPVNQQDIYFTPEYYQLYENYGDGKAICFVFEKDGEIALYPFLLNCINDIGYNLNDKYYDIQGAYGYNGVISTSYNDKFITTFFDNFNEFCNKNNIIAEFIRFHPLIKNYKFTNGKLDIFFDRNTIYIDLNQKYEFIFNNFQTSTKKQIKRCYNKYNLQIEIVENDISKIYNFYNIYKEAMLRVQSSEYLFFNLDYFKDLILNTKSVLFFANFEGKPVAAIIAFYNKYFIHGHLGGALTDYLFTSSYSLLYSEMIKYGIKNECKYFHVGGGTTSNIDDNLLKFKLNFSSSKSDFYIGKLIHNKVVYNEIVCQWNKSNPQKMELYKNFVLKYRF